MRALHSVLAATAVRVHRNMLVDAGGRTVILRGANRSGTEFDCINAPAFADGPTDAVSLDAMRAWGLNAVRVPLNEDCWLGINGVGLSGDAYQANVERYVQTIVANGMYPILDLHITAPGAIKATSQQPMPDSDHSISFWRGVASMFGHNNAVIFDLFNEPFPANSTNSTAAWTCWRDGCQEPSDHGGSFRAAGMQSLVSAVRQRGATNVLMVGGIQFANTIDQWLNFKPNDPLHNMAAAQHFYYAGACSASACWSATTAVVARVYPVIIGEVGDTDCTINNTAQVLSFFETHGISYLAWDWGPDFGCQSLIKGYDGQPTQPYGQWFHDWALRAQGQTIRPEPLATFYNNTGVVADGKQASCGFDDQNYCYSSQALAKGGLLTRGTIAFNSATFQWNPPLGTVDNVVPAGQTVAISPTVSGAVALNVLGAAAHGPGGGAFTLFYTDGTSTTRTLTLSDWTLTASNGAAQQVEAGNTVLVTASYRDKSDGSTQATKASLFGIAIALDSTRTLSSVRLPVLTRTPYAPQLHIFALSVTSKRSS